MTNPTSCKSWSWLLAHNFTVSGSNVMLNRVHEPIDPPDLDRMPCQEQQDLFNFSRKPMTAWESRLHPPTASRWRLGSLLVVGVLVVAWFAFKPVNPPETLKKVQGDQRFGSNRINRALPWARSCPEAST